MVLISIISEVYEVHCQKLQVNSGGKRRGCSHRHTESLPGLSNSWLQARSMHQLMNVSQEAREETMHSSLLKFNFVTYLLAMKIHNKDNKKGNRGTFSPFLYWNYLLFVQHSCAPSRDQQVHFPFVML